MAYINRKEFQALLDRVKALEDAIGANVKVPTVEHILGVEEVYGEKAAPLLLAAGYKTPYEVRSASDEELLSVDGIGPATLKAIRAAG